MSTDYAPKRPNRVIRTPLSFKDGSFNVTVYGHHVLGDLHVALGLPIDPYTHESNIKYYDGDGYERVPFEATAKEARTWAKTITRALMFIEDDDDNKSFIAAWRDFLATCSGYRARL